MVRTQLCISFIMGLRHCSSLVLADAFFVSSATPSRDQSRRYQVDHHSTRWLHASAKTSNTMFNAVETCMHTKQIRSADWLQTVLKLRQCRMDVFYSSRSCTAKQHRKGQMLARQLQSIRRQSLNPQPDASLTTRTAFDAQSVNEKPQRGVIQDRRHWRHPLAMWLGTTDRGVVTCWQCR